MRRSRPVEPRRVIFIGVEGPSDRAFVRFLDRCSDRERLHLHLDVKPANGGDTVLCGPGRRPPCIKAPIVCPEAGAA